MEADMAKHPDGPGVPKPKRVEIRIGEDIVRADGGCDGC
jgi:hypothetical protein